MGFSKSFPKTKDKYPVWEEVYLSKEEEIEEEKRAREENINLMEDCLKDARQVLNQENIKEEANVVRMAVAFFEKIASHQVYYKEAKAKEKFDSSIKQDIEKKTQQL